MFKDRTLRLICMGNEKCGVREERRRGGKGLEEGEGKGSRTGKDVGKKKYSGNGNSLVRGRGVEMVKDLDGPNGN